MPIKISRRSCFLSRAVVKRADLCGVWDVKFTLVSYGSGGGNIGERLSELERRMDELTKRIDDAASAGGAGR